MTFRSGGTTGTSRSSVAWAGGSRTPCRRSCSVWFCSCWLGDSIPRASGRSETAWGRRSGSGSCGSSCCRSWPSCSSSRSSESPWGCSYSLGSGSCTRSATWSAVSPSAGSSSRSQLLGTSRSSPDGGHCGCSPSSRSSAGSPGSWGRCSGLGRFGSPHGHRAGIGRSGSPSRRAPSAKRSRLAAPLQVERGWALSTDPISLRPFRGRSHTDAC